MRTTRKQKVKVAAPTHMRDKCAICARLFEYSETGHAYGGDVRAHGSCIKRLQENIAQSLSLAISEERTDKWDAVGKFINGQLGTIRERLDVIALHLRFATPTVDLIVELKKFNRAIRRYLKTIGYLVDNKKMQSLGAERMEVGHPMESRSAVAGQSAISDVGRLGANCVGTRHSNRGGGATSVAPSFEQMAKNIRNKGRR